MTRQQCVKLAQALGADGFVTLSTSGPAPNGLEHTGSRSFLNLGIMAGLARVLVAADGKRRLAVRSSAPRLAEQDGKLCAHAHWIMADLRK